MPRRFKNFSVCLGNTLERKIAEGSAETFVYYVINDFGIPQRLTHLVLFFFICPCYSKRTHYPTLEKPVAHNIEACEKQVKQRKLSDH